MPAILLEYLDEFTFVMALTIDTFTISLLYGSQGIKIPFLSNCILNTIATAVLIMSVICGTMLRAFIPELVTRYLSFLILLCIGVYKCVESLCSTKVWEADKNHDHILSPVEAMGIAISLSMDGVSVGIGAALLTVHSYAIGFLSLLIGICAVSGGGFLGRLIGKRTEKDYSFIGGLAMIFFAFTKI